MALRGCFGCLKFLVFIVNFLFCLFGFGVMAISLWLLFDQQLYLQSVGADRADYFIGTYINLGVGALMILVGFLGCCGALKESPCMLGMFFVFQALILICELVVGVLIYLQVAPYEDVISKSIKTTVTKKYHPNSTSVTVTFDMIQQGLQCCGADGPGDWAVSVYNGHVEDDIPEIGIPQSNGELIQKLGHNFRVPASCCNVEPTSPTCLRAIKGLDLDNLITYNIYEQGCSEKMVHFVESHFIYLLAVFSSVVIIQLFGMVFSLCLCCALKKIEDYKT